MADKATVLINNEEFELKLTLGGLSRLEEELGCDLSGLEARLAAPSAGDIEKIALIMIRCGGEKVPDDFFMTADVAMEDILPAILAAFERAFKSRKAPKSGNVPRAKNSPASPGTTGTDSPE